MRHDHRAEAVCFNGNANLVGTTDGKTMNGYCLNLQSSNVDGSFVILLNGTGRVTTTSRRSSPTRPQLQEKRAWGWTRTTASRCVSS